MTRRERFAFDLHPEYLKIYNKLCNLLPDHWQPYSSFRSFGEQANLYAKGRTLLGQKIVTNAPPGASAHNYGAASDWTIFINKVPIWMEQNDDRWAEYHEACQKAGALWGGSFKRFPDYYHNELPLVFSWSEALEVYRDIGKEAANEFITRNLARL